LKQILRDAESHHIFLFEVSLTTPVFDSSVGLLSELNQELRGQTGDALLDHQSTICFTQYYWI
jgi:hypothetical protein